MVLWYYGIMVLRYYGTNVQAIGFDVLPNTQYPLPNTQYLVPNT